MFKLQYRNPRGESVEFFGIPYKLLSVEGLGDVGVENTMQKSVNQDGASIVNTLLEARSITITIKIVGKDYADLERKRRDLSGVLSPKLGEGTLEYIGSKRKAIKCIVESAPYYPDGPDNRGSTFQKVQIDLIAPGSYWLDAAPNDHLLVDVVPMFSFPLEIFDEGIELSTLSNGYIEIDNKGDAPTPLEFEIFGPAETPIVINETTGDFIKVKRTLLANERMIINTAHGNKTVEIIEDNGTIRNVFNYIDLDSVFFMLEPGVNGIKFDAAVGSDDAKVNIKYKTRYVGI